MHGYMDTNIRPISSTKLSAAFGPDARCKARPLYTSVKAGRCLGMHEIHPRRTGGSH
jgi:hypothetical protein